MKTDWVSEHLSARTMIQRRLPNKALRLQNRKKCDSHAVLRKKNHQSVKGMWNKNTTDIDKNK